MELDVYVPKLGTILDMGQSANQSASVNAQD
jgi:hypothetical protein